MTKIFAGEPFCAVFQNFSGSEKDYEKGGGGKSRFSLETFLSHSSENFPRRNLLVFHYFRVWKKFGLERGGESRFSVENFLSHKAE